MPPKAEDKANNTPKSEIESSAPSWPQAPTTKINSWEVYRSDLSDDIRRALQKLPENMKKEVELIERFSALKNENPSLEVVDYLKKNSRLTDFQYNKEVNRIERQNDIKHIENIKRMEKLRGKDPTIAVLDYMKQRKMITETQYNKAMANYNKVLDGEMKDLNTRFNNLKDDIKTKGTDNPASTLDSTSQSKNNKQLEKDVDNLSPNHVKSSEVKLSTDFSKRIDNMGKVLERANNYIDGLNDRAKNDVSRTGAISEKTRNEAQRFRNVLPKIVNSLNELTHDVRSSNLSTSIKNQLNKQIMDKIDVFKQVRKKFNELSSKTMERMGGKRENDIKMTRTTNKDKGRDNI